MPVKAPKHDMREYDPDCSTFATYCQYVCIYEEFLIVLPFVVFMSCLCAYNISKGHCLLFLYNEFNMFASALALPKKRSAEQKLLLQ